METILAATPLIGPAEQQAVARVLASGQLVQGSEVAAFEEEFSAVVGGRPCVAVSSGTSALHLGLLSCGIGPGDEVIVPSLTFAATANAIALTGATPVFADIEPDHFCLDPASVAAAITPRTVGIMPVHLYGHPADMDSLGEIATRHGLALLEDACQAHLATWRGRPVGTFGRFAAFSFYATKNMTTGEGGMVVCSDEEQAQRVQLLRSHGMERKYKNEIVGFNARMTDLAAAIGRVQLQRLPELTDRRRQNAAILDARLAAVPNLRIPRTADAATHVHHQYTVRAPDRNALADGLRQSGIGSIVHYPVPCHRLPAFRSDRGDVVLTETERACREVLSLPVHPGLADRDLDRIVAAMTALMS